MDILGQSALILAVTAFSLALAALSRNLRNKLVMSYSALCGVVSLWALGFFLEKIFENGSFYKVHLIFNLVLAPVSLSFIRTLTRVETGFTRWLFNASMVYALALIGLQMSSFGDHRVVLNLIYFAPTFIALNCLYLMLIDWEVKLGKIRRLKVSQVGLTRRTWVYSGAILLLLLAVMDHVPFLGEILPSVGNIFLGLYLFMVSEAIIQQRLLNVAAMGSRIVVMALICASLSFVFFGLTGWIENSPDLFVLNTVLASFIILMLIDPLKRVINMSVLRVVSPKYLRLEKRIEEHQRALTGVLDTAGVAELALTVLENTLPLDSATVFVLRSDGTKYARILGRGDEALENREILSNHPLIDFFIRMRRRGETPVILDSYLENEIDRTTSQLQRQTYDLVLKGLHALNANIAVPFIDSSSASNEVFGFVAVRAPQPPEPWGNNWGLLSVIYPFFTQAARTLKNMEVYVRLREKERLAALGEMAAGLAHEIRNPLGAIKGATQYLEGSASEAHSPFLSVIVEEVNRLNAVVTEFLDYSRPYSAEFVPTDIGFVLQRTHALFQGLQAGKEGRPPISIELIAPKGGYSALPQVVCSPEQIKQILVNLVQNAVQSLEREPPASGGRIQIGARLDGKRLQRGQEMVVLFVEDNGKGIAREHLEKIFIPFFTTTPKGTGLGLAICSRIAEAHGGRMEVLSDEGKFTRFSVYLPVSKQE